MTFEIKFKRRRPTWVLQLTNAGLINAFIATYDARGALDDTPNLMRCLGALSDEIARRYSVGTIKDDDWTSSTETR
jgi:hypothetical protein